MQSILVDRRPKRVDIGIYRGDSFGEGWWLRVPDYSGEGGPETLDEPGVTHKAQIRPEPDSPVIYAEFAITVLDPAARFIKPTLTGEQTAQIPRDAWWDIEIIKGSFHRTYMQGAVLLGKDTTRLQ